MLPVGTFTQRTPQARRLLPKRLRWFLLGMLSGVAFCVGGFTLLVGTL